MGFEGVSLKWEASPLPWNLNKPTNAATEAIKYAT